MRDPFAFPSQALGSDGLPQEDAGYGMTLRDYFAAHALPGLLVRRWEDGSGNVPVNVHKLWASAAYQLADAMLAKRSEPQKSEQP